MPTKGQITRSRIEQAARSLAVEQGFSGASQRAIAEQAGVDKPLVQYHFPEKRDFVRGFIEDMLDAEATFAEQAGWARGGYFENLMVIGGMHFAYLLEAPKMERITPDLLVDRENTEALMDAEVRWATEYLGFVPAGEKRLWESVVAMIMGGAYGLIYRTSRGKADVRPEDLIKMCIQMEMAYLGKPEGEIGAVLSSYREASYDKLALFAHLDAALFAKGGDAPIA